MVSKNLMELHKDFIPFVPFLLYACIFMQDFYSQVLQLSSSPADNFFHRAESRRFFFVWNYKKTVRSSSLAMVLHILHTLEFVNESVLKSPKILFTIADITHRYWCYVGILPKNSDFTQKNFDLENDRTKIYLLN